jgi:pyridoxamine 5'-phosphate oxidase
MLCGVGRDRCHQTKGHNTVSAGSRDLPLRRNDLRDDPLDQFASWFREAGEAGIVEAEAAALATASAGGVPSARMVLVKRFDQRGFLFFTSYVSRKARELEENPRAALLWHWRELGRQVRIEGAVEPATRQETEEYVLARHPASRLSALASPQSRPVESREWLEERVRELERRYAGVELPVPDDWGGYRLVPSCYEFWQHRESRLHDRFLYTALPEEGWKIERLAP